MFLARYFSALTITPGHFIGSVSGFLNLKNHDKVQHVSIADQDIHLKKEDIPAIINILRGNPQIQDLKINTSRLSPQDTALLLEGLSDTRGLKTFIARDMNIHSISRNLHQYVIDATKELVVCQKHGVNRIHFPDSHISKDHIPSMIKPYATIDRPLPLVRVGEFIFSNENKHADSYEKQMDMYYNRCRGPFGML